MWNGCYKAKLKTAANTDVSHKAHKHSTNTGAKETSPQKGRVWKHLVYEKICTFTKSCSFYYVFVSLKEWSKKRNSFSSSYLDPDVTVWWCYRPRLHGTIPSAWKSSSATLLVTDQWDRRCESATENEWKCVNVGKRSDRLNEHVPEPMILFFFKQHRGIHKNNSLVPSVTLRVN